MISKNRICVITKSRRFFGITLFFIYISQIDFFIQKIGLFFISQNQFCDIKNRFGYIKFDFVISQSGGLLCIQVSFRTLSIRTFNCQKPKAQICIYVFVSFSGFSLENYVW